METIKTFFFHKALSAKVWCALFCASWLMQLVMALASMYKPETIFKVLNYNGDSILVHTTLDFEESNQLHLDMVKLALEAQYLRGPHGLDNEERMAQMYLPDAYQKALKGVEMNSARFREFGFQQKITFSDVQIFEASDHTVRAIATGQLIRTGQIAGRGHSEADQFEASLKMVFNPRIMTNSYYPVVVYDFEIDIQPTHSR